ncbi:hypothetical protein GCM10027054_39320 [Isoptericola nanjingensis]
MRAVVAGVVPVAVLNAGLLGGVGGGAVGVGLGVVVVTSRTVVHARPERPV